MFFKTETKQSIQTCSDKIRQLKQIIASADNILIGAGAGLSTAASLTYSGARFDRFFSDFKEKYGITDMYSGGFYPFDTLEEYWAWWSRHILINRYEVTVGAPYFDLLSLVKDKNYFVLTTNVDHQFQLAGFDKKRLFYTQGDYGLWQCSKACHAKTYDNESAVREMVSEQTNMKIPAALLPKCPVCGAPMTMNLRSDNSFVQDNGWYAAAQRYEHFLQRYKDAKILFLELGVGANTPAIIKYPFWQMTAQNRAATYACINLGMAICPRELTRQAICIDADICAVLPKLLRQTKVESHAVPRADFSVCCVKNT